MKRLILVKDQTQKYTDKNLKQRVINIAYLESHLSWRFDRFFNVVGEYVPIESLSFELDSIYSIQILKDIVIPKEHRLDEEEIDYSINPTKSHTLVPNIGTLNNGNFRDQKSIFDKKTFSTKSSVQDFMHSRGQRELDNAVLPIPKRHQHASPNESVTMPITPSCTYLPEDDFQSKIEQLKAHLDHTIQSPLKIDLFVNSFCFAHNRTLVQKLELLFNAVQECDFDFNVPNDISETISFMSIPGHCFLYTP